MIDPRFTALVLVAALAACSGPRARQPAPISTVAPAATAPAMSVAERNCLSAVANEVGAGNVSLIRTETSEAATGVYVQVPGAEAPWLCLANDDGSVSEVRYTGSEGRL